MRKIFLTFIAFMAFSNMACAETITASVNGLVCAFCATGIEKTFMKQPAVKVVKVDLDAKQVTITTRDKQDIDDKTVTKLITDAGYAVTGIKRGNGHASAR